MKKVTKIDIKPQFLIFTLTLLCILCLILSVVAPGFFKPLKNAAATIVIPLQDGVNHIGNWFLDQAETQKTIEELEAENERLQQQVDNLTEENSLLAQNKYELTRLRELYQLDQDYSSYEKIGANVIGKDTGNWFSVFTINKGSDDGIKENMNVISDGGLVGIVYEVGKNYSKVRSIIDDESSVSVSFADSSDTGIVNGDLQLYNDGYLNITGVLKDTKVSEGDIIVTSKVSDKFLPGILVGYVDSVSLDSNELTLSGNIIPAVDFRNIDEVLVITQLKDDLEK